MKGGNFTVDVPGFDRTMREYAGLTKKTNQEICNGTILQIAFEGQRQTPLASKAQIELLPDKPWWPAYVSKRMRAALKGHSGKMKRGSFARLAYRGEAEAFSKKILAARKRSVAFMKAGYLPTIRTLYPKVKDKDLKSKSIGGAKQYGRDKGSCIPALAESHPFAELTNSAKGIEKMGLEPLKRAVEIVKADKEVYIARKHQETIDRFKW